MVDIWIGGSSSRAGRVILIILIVVILVIVGILIWIFVVSPASTDTGDGNGNGNGGPSCTEAPGSPTGLLAAASGSSNSVALSWSDDGAATSWTVYVSTNPGITIQNAEESFDVSSPNFQHLNLIPQTYYYRVTASNACGESDLSAQEVNASNSFWPEKFKYCKRTNNAFCVNIPQNTGFFGGGIPTVQTTCSGGACELTGAPTTIELFSPADAYCMQASELLVGSVAAGEVQLCDGSNEQTWSYDINTGALRSERSWTSILLSPPYCLGAADTELDSVSLRPCNSGDEEQQWDIVPVP